MDEKRISRILVQIYERLYQAYGPQRWWPADSPFEVMVGAVLTQSAAWANVVKAIDNLKKANALTPLALREMPEVELARLVYPSGYYNVKARKLKAFTQWLGERCGDDLEKLFSGNTSELRRELLGVYGVGEETADSILLYAGNKPVFVIDAYTRRVIGRLGLTPRPAAYADYQKLFMDALPPDAALFNEYHALLVNLGKETCRKKPLCTRCCLSRRGSVAAFPCAVK